MVGGASEKRGGGFTHMEQHFQPLVFDTFVLRGAPTDEVRDGFSSPEAPPSPLEPGLFTCVGFVGGGGQ